MLNNNNHKVFINTIYETYMNREEYDGEKGR